MKKLKKILALSAAFAVAGAIFLSPAFAEQENPAAAPQEAVADPIQEKGKQLNTAIDEAYARLADSKAGPVFSSNDITAVVAHYVPEGISFNEAEAILHAAGFHMGQRPSVLTIANSSRPEECDVTGAISPYFVEDGFRADINVRLSPKNIGDYGEVGHITAEIALTNAPVKPAP